MTVSGGGNSSYRFKAAGLGGEKEIMVRTARFSCLTSKRCIAYPCMMSRAEKVASFAQEVT
jgi:hypothetical protein